MAPLPPSNLLAEPNDEARTGDSHQQTKAQIVSVLEYLRRSGFQIIPPQPDTTVIHEEAPDASGKPAPIWRTIICSEGPLLNRVKRFYPVDEEGYYSIRDKDLGSAIELVKEVDIIPKDQATLKHRQRGNEALSGAIVQEVTSERIVVRCPLLCKEIRSIIYWPSAAFYNGSRSLEFNTPYRAIGAHRQEFGQRQAVLEARVQEGATPNAADRADCVALLDHLKLFLEQVDRVQRDGIREEQKRNAKKMVTFDYLWVLFKPGKVVCVDIGGAMIACCVKLLVWGDGDVLSRRSSEDSYRQVELRVWFLDHDGATINRRQHSIVIPRFEGEKAISELPVRPRDLISKEMRQEKEERGRRYYDVVKRAFSVCSYKGMLSTTDPYNPESHREFTGNVIVDPELYHRENGPTKGVQWLDEADTQSAALGQDMKQFVKVKPSAPAHPLTENFFFLLTDWVRGFTISTRGSRIWAWFNVQGLQDYEFNRDLKHTIALPDHDLEDIGALTQRPNKHLANSEEVELPFSPDPIEHKGEGCVILLHGPPGLGKTYTVECIAEHAERPLLRLTCAELGLEPTKLEKTLEKYLRWSERWQAIVLVDEADVFTSKRITDASISREAIVAVLLKSLEYYSGIIFLTTNRVDTFDVAVIDRVDLIVRFRPLNSFQKKKIRGNCIDRLKIEGVVLLDSEANSSFATIDEDKEYSWNGREIVQVLKLAGRLALSDYHGTIEERRSAKPRITTTFMERAKGLIKRHAIYRVSQEMLDTAELPTKEQIYRRDFIG